MLLYFLLKIPLIVTQMVPAAVLAATLLSLGSLARRNELMAMRACGVSLEQIGTPVLALTLALSLATLAWNEFVVPPAAARAHWIQTVEIKKQTFHGHFQHLNIWYHHRHGFTNIESFDPKANEIRGLTRYEFDDGFHLKRVVAAPSAKWIQNAWHAPEGYEVVVAAGGTVETRPLPGVVLEMSETPKDFTAVYRESEDLSFAALASEIRNLRAKGIDTTEDQVELWLKLAVPFASLVMGMIGVPLASRHSRQSSMAANIGIALVVGFSYWIVLGLMTSLAKGGALPPALSAWGANLLFSIIGAIFFLSSD
jgi:lipopolysaccharide export system permease protein